MIMSQINMIFIRSLVLFLALTTIHAQNECSGGNANCINIRNCPQIMSILIDPTPPSKQMLQTLRNLQCGFESNDPKYCCNQVTTTTTTTIKPEIAIPPPPDITNHPNLRLLDHRACGPVPQHRAIDSNETEIFQYPWMTIILYEIKGIIERWLTWIRGDIYCTGTIISSRYVLTAAHCFYIQDYTVKSVRVGDHDRSKEHDCMTNNKGLEILCAGKYQDYDVDSIHPHPGYTKNNLQDDIGLIRLIDSIDFRPQSVRPICLPFDTAATLNHKRVIATGWQRHEKLQQAKLSLVTNEQCKQMYKDIPNGIYWRDFKIYYYINPDITYKLLCAGQENEDTCTSERGGPLQAAGIYNGGSVRIIQHGVCNIALNCLHRVNPRVYIRVSYYMNWILNTMTD